MQSVIYTFLDLCRLRRGPQDLPASQSLFIGSGLLLVVVAIISDQMHGDFAGRLLFAVAQVGILSVIVWVILSLQGKAERVPQTLTAFYGTGIIIQLLIWPFRLWIVSLGDAAQEQGLLPLLAIVTLAVWSFIIMIHIYRNALDSSTGKAVLISIITQMIIGLSMFNMFSGMQQV
jgi:hypothetical protein